MEIKGIDISYCQRGIDYKKAKTDGVKFAIIRTGYKEKTDDMLYIHLDGCIDAGIKYGFYVYAVATSVDEAKKEALHCIKSIKGYNPEYPIFYDLEDSRLESLSKNEVTEIALAFLTEIKNAGYYPAVYINPSWLENRVIKEKIMKYDIWLAAWTNDPNKPTKYDYGQKMWQWGIDSVAGIGEVDGNLCYVDYPAIIGKKAENADKASEPIKSDDFAKFKWTDKAYRCIGSAVRLRKFPSENAPIIGTLEKNMVYNVNYEIYVNGEKKWLLINGGFSMLKDQIGDVLFGESEKLALIQSLKVGDRVKIVGKYAAAASAPLANYTTAIGGARYIVRIVTGAAFPYQLGVMPQNLTAANTTGYADILSIQKI